MVASEEIRKAVREKAQLLTKLNEANARLMVARSSSNTSITNPEYCTPRLEQSIVDSYRYDSYGKSKTPIEQTRSGKNDHCRSIQFSSDLGKKKAAVEKPQQNCNGLSKFDKAVPTKYNVRKPEIGNQSNLIHKTPLSECNMNTNLKKESPEQSSVKKPLSKSQKETLNPAAEDRNCYKAPASLLDYLT